MIVVAIIALLAAIAVPNFLRSRKRSPATANLEDLRVIDGAVDQYAIEYKKSPGDTVAWGDVQSYIKKDTPSTPAAARISSATHSPCRWWTARRKSPLPRMVLCRTSRRRSSGRPSINATRPPER